MPEFQTWINKVKQTKLRYWLNLAELEELLSKNPKPRLYLVLESYAGLQALTVRVEEVKERVYAEATDKKELKNLLLACTLIRNDEQDHPIDLNVAWFIPQDPNNELRTLSRLFVDPIRRDHFIEDLLFCNEVQQEAAIEANRRMANRFFRRFFGGGSAESEAE